MATGEPIAHLYGEPVAFANRLKDEVKEKFGFTVNVGIRTIGDLAQMDPEILEAHLKSFGKLIWENANGIGSDVVESEETAAKGVGNSTTLSSDVTDAENAKKVLLSLAESVSGRLRKHEFLAGNATVEIKYADVTF